MFVYLFIYLFGLKGEDLVPNTPTHILHKTFIWNIKFFHFFTKFLVFLVFLGLPDVQKWVDSHGWRVWRGHIILVYFKTPKCVVESCNFGPSVWSVIWDFFTPFHSNLICILNEGILNPLKYNNINNINLNLCNVLYVGSN